MDSPAANQKPKMTVAEKLISELNACKEAVIGDLQAKVSADVLELVRGALSSYIDDRATGKKKGKGTKRKAAEGAEPKKPNAYNIFVRETMKAIRTENPTVSNTDAMKIVAQKWSEAKAAKAADSPASPVDETPATPATESTPTAAPDTTKKVSAPAKKKAAAK